MDCHLAYSVDSVAVTKSLGSGPNQLAATGTFYVVTLRTWFDPRTISPHRGNGPLDPGARIAEIVDETGRVFHVSSQGERALGQVSGEETSLRKPLRPGESSEATLVFDLPPDVTNPRLLVTDTDWITRFLIGHGLSFFHKKIFFRLDTSPAPAPASTDGIHSLGTFLPLV